MDLPLSDEEAAASRRRFARVLLGVLASYFLLVKLFHGDFWPFSRFPMFARSGRPWARAMLRELSPAELDRPWRDVSEGELPGVKVKMHALHKNQDDISTVVGKMKEGVSPVQQAFLADYFAEARATRHLVLYSVRGRLRPGKDVEIVFHPLALLGPDGVRVLSTSPAAQPASSAASGAPSVGPTPGGKAP